MNGFKKFIFSNTNYRGKTLRNNSTWRKNGISYNAETQKIFKHPIHCA
eukprot:UN18028